MLHIGKVGNEHAAKYCFNKYGQAQITNDGNISLARHNSGMDKIDSVETVSFETRQVTTIRGLPSWK